jgi:splicing factor 3A subunit 1
MPIPEMQTAQQSDVVIATALDPEMKIKKNYQRGGTEETKKQETGTQRCPKCQQEIPIGEWKEHMRLELMDPKQREEKLKREERAKLNSLAAGDEIAANLKRFAQERKDIFPN